MLKKFDSTPLVEALRIALPILFQINLSTKIDHENIPQLTDFLAFASKNNVNDQCTMNIVSALTIHGTKLTGDHVMSIIWSLAEMRNYQAAYSKLLSNAFFAINRNFEKISFHNQETTLDKMTQRIMNNFPDFYNEQFINSCAINSVEMDVGFKNSIYILKKLNKISFINLDLLDYVSKLVEKDPSHLIDCRFTQLYTFVTGFSTANYCSPNWPIISEYIFQNSTFQSNRNELPWMRFCLELCSLNCFNSDLIEKIFQTDFLEKHLSRENNFLDYIQMLSLYHCSKLLMTDYKGQEPDKEFLDKAIEMSFSREIFPLKQMLEFGFNDAQNVLTKVATKHGQLVDHVVVLRNDEPVNIGSFTGTLEELQELYKDAKM